MQTIKTAAIVVLMLTVLYGGYVSLTTPPEPLPEEISDILIIDESGEGAFDSADGLAAGLELGQPPEGVLSIESNVPAVPAAATDTDLAALPPSAPLDSPLGSAPMASKSLSAETPSLSGIQSLPAGSSAASSGPATYGSSFADLPPNRTTTAELASVRKDKPLQGATKKLPAVGPGTAIITPGPADSYASTDDAFQLPDPEVAQTKFDPSRGTPFTDSGAAEFKLSDQPATALEAVAEGASTKKQNLGLLNAFKIADGMYAKGQLKEALATLSVFYGIPEMNESERAQLLSRLDPLAREVIYSKRHLLEQPHRVGTSETLVQIASKYEVPWQLLANINGVADPITVLPGTELKIIRGPFRADVDLTKKELTLFLGDLYAGRFDIEVGSDPPPSAGTFTIQEKQTAHVFYDRAGVPVQPGSPDNPYGSMWLDLGGQICIHGSPNTVQPTNAGCISVADDFADDVYAILSQGSSVTIRR